MHSVRIFYFLPILLAGFYVKFACTLQNAMDLVPRSMNIYYGRIARLAYLPYHCIERPSGIDHFEAVKAYNALSKILLWPKYNGRNDMIG